MYSLLLCSSFCLWLEKKWRSAPIHTKCKIAEYSLKCHEELSMRTPGCTEDTEESGSGMCYIGHINLALKTMYQTNHSLRHDKQATEISTFG